MHSRVIRLLALSVFVATWGGAPTARAQEAPRTRADIARSLEANVPDGFTLAAVGDMQLVHAVGSLRDPGFQATVNWIRAADVAVGNLETTLFDVRNFTGYPQAIPDSLRPRGAPEVAQDLRNMGFTMVTRANNHAMDWGMEGMRQTNRLLDDSRVMHAGTGENRAMARAPNYVDTAKGRIALVSVTSTFDDATSALPPLGQAPGRPGASTLRTRRVVLVDQTALRALRAVQDSLPKGSVEISPENGPVSLFGVTYAASDKFGFRYEVDRTDQEEILRAVRQGKLNSDFLILGVHSHEPGNWSEQPADFLSDLARAAIDAGADAVVGHGPHRLRGIEIYKGKPIFYSLGNYFFQIATQEPAAADMYDKLFGDPRLLTDVELHQARIGPHVENPALQYYESVVAVSRFENGRVTEIELYPIELSLQARIANRGIPRVATGAGAMSTLENLARLSQPFGTSVQIRNGRGVISVGGKR